MKKYIKDIKVTLTQNPKTKPDPSTLNFGEVFTDHMFTVDYDEGIGWHNPEIVPYGPITLDPAASVLHYAQEMFEGLKAYRTVSGEIQLFRPEMNARRTNVTNERICIPTLDEEFYVNAVKSIVSVDADWVPDRLNTSLYIRPYIFASEPFLGVRPANQYKFMIILSPVGAYYKGGLTPTKIFVEDEYVRAVDGLTGNAKIGGNYAATLKSQVKAHNMGFAQVLWLDGKERKYVEEIGTSNAFFVINEEVYTAPLNGSILPGITRDSAITILRDKGITVREERFTINDIYDAAAKGTLSEVFASGTAAVISPVGEMLWKNNSIIINNNEIGPLSQELYDTITGIQNGKVEDLYGWTVKL